MIKISLIVGAALVAAALLRRQSAAVRHWLLAVAILCAAATPALERLVPSWRMPSVAPMAPAPSLRLTETITVIGNAPAGVPRAEGATRPPTADLLRVAWIAGTVISLALLLVGLVRLWSVARRARRIVDGPWFEIAADLSRTLDLRRRVALLESDHPTLLVTWGFSRPTVLLPAAARGWSADRVRVVLQHELAHVRRGDWLVQIVAELLRAVYWFNPLLWIACARLRQESELACDDAVMNGGVEASEYAGHLVDLARALSARPWFPAPAMARPSSLERRVCAMLNSRMNRVPLTRSARFATAAAVAVLTLAIAGYGAGAQAAASFSGTAVDATGRIMPNVTLALTNVQSKARQETRTDSTGHFSFTGLAGGEYAVETDVAGFSKDAGRVLIGDGQRVEQDVTLQLGSVTETINVWGGGDPAKPAVTPRPARPREDPAADPCHNSPVGGCIKPPTKVRDVKPVYSQQLQDARIEGRILLEGRIGTDGFLKSLRVVQPANADLAKAALDAVNQWQFTPTRLGGVAMETAIAININFTAAR